MADDDKGKTREEEFGVNSLTLTTDDQGQLEFKHNADGRPVTITPSAAPLLEDGSEQPYALGIQKFDEKWALATLYNRNTGEPVPHTSFTFQWVTF